MKIIVNSLIHHNDRPFADFSCSVGCGRAVLCSSAYSNLGFLGKQLDAELDIDVPLQIGKNCVYDDSKNTSISFDGEFVVLKIKVEQQDDDGMTFFRLSNDCIIMAEFEGEENLQVHKMLLVKIAPEEISITLT